MKKLMRYSLMSFFSILFFSCSLNNDSEDINNSIIKENEHLNKNSSGLSDDINFINLVLEMESFKSFINQVIVNNNLSLSEVELELEELNSLNYDYENQISKVNLIFNEDVSSAYITHVENFNEAWLKIQTDYPDLDEVSIKDSYATVLEKTDANGSVIGFECGWRYNLCIAGAGAAAVLCHAGCDTTALATTGGLGIPACIWLCGTVQVAASAACYDQYCN
ncbi:hypothetical protein [Mangrovimonas cancribranchiae]|uniref:Bacteriocin fulvocin C-related protein n=1 Tax=Mangrovimonas cancribranchiae TaxID=3080055 RepID=A0AAU6P2I1_9FLAO